MEITCTNINTVDLQLSLITICFSLCPIKLQNFFISKHIPIFAAAFINFEPIWSCVWYWFKYYHCHLSDLSTTSCKAAFTMVWSNQRGNLKVTLYPDKFVTVQAVVSRIYCEIRIKGQLYPQNEVWYCLDALNYPRMTQMSNDTK